MKIAISLLISFTFLVACSENIPASYKTGEAEVTLHRIANSDVYLDQYERLWALVATNKDETLFKAVPAGDNSCLNENPRHYPGFEDTADLSKYIFTAGQCRLKQTPYNNFTFNATDNEAIEFRESPCARGYELDGPCIKVAPDADQSEKE